MLGLESGRVEFEHRGEQEVPGRDFFRRGEPCMFATRPAGPRSSTQAQLGGINGLLYSFYTPAHDPIDYCSDVSGARRWMPASRRYSREFVSVARGVLLVGRDALSTWSRFRRRTFRSGVRDRGNGRY